MAQFKKFVKNINFLGSVGGRVVSMLTLFILRSEFESHWSLQYFRKIVAEKNKISKIRRSGCDP